MTESAIDQPDTRYPEEPNAPQQQPPDTRENRPQPMPMVTAFLRSLPTFSSMSDADIERIAQACEEEIVIQGETIFSEGSVGDRLYIIWEGSIAVHKEPVDLRIPPLSTYSAGQIFGEMALIDSLPRSATAIAQEHCRLLSLCREEFDRVISEHSGMAIAIMRSITGMIRASNDIFVDGLKQSHSRLETAYQQLKTEVEERRRAEGELNAYKRQLEDLVGERTAQLTSANEELRQEIEERRSAQKQRELLEIKLRRTEKLEAVGTLAGGVAHDLNNILAGLVSYPELLLLKLPEDDPMRGPVQTIKKSGEKAAAIVNDLLALARGNAANFEVINLNLILLDYLSSPENQSILHYHPTVAITRDLSEDLQHTKGSFFHLSKVAMNLVSNAAEAMPDGGTIHIETRNISVADPIDSYERIPPGDYAQFRVSDTGVGIAPEDLERIFEPFFTKKQMGRSGTGLGMAVVWGTIKDHGGFIDVEQRADGGTRFSLYFPIAKDGEPTQPRKLDMDELSGRGETVLIVDDVAEQRNVAAKILTTLDYQVSAVDSGEAAIVYLETNTVDLVLLDMIMDPGIDGLETYRRIRDITPGQRVLISSGFSETQRVKEARLLGAVGFLGKPFRLETIGMAVKEALTTPIV